MGKCFLEVSKSSHSDVPCGNLDYRIVKMEGLFAVIQKLKKTNQSNTFTNEHFGTLSFFGGKWFWKTDSPGWAISAAQNEDIPTMLLHRM